MKDKTALNPKNKKIDPGSAGNEAKVRVQRTKIIDADEEHKIILPGIDIAISHTLKLVIMVDQTGGQDNAALKDLESYLKEKGYFLHCVVVAPPSEKEVIE